MNKNNNYLRELTDDELKQLHTCLLNILQDFIFVCEKYHLKYTLGGGSVLGAVRHRGFIPWDDDLDVNMPRDDYERFKEVFTQELADKYELQVPNSEYGTLTLFMKLLKKGTAYQQQFSYNENDKPYVWIDIFPFDNVPNNKYIRFIKGLCCQIFAYSFVSKYIYEHRTAATDEYYQKGGWKRKLKYKTRLWLAKLIPVHYNCLYNFFDKFVRNSGPSHWMTCATGRKHYLGEIVDANYFKKAEQGIFENKTVLLPYRYKDYLTSLYGNYMQLPPVNKREHHWTTKFYIPDDLDFKVYDVTKKYMQTIPEVEFIKKYGMCMYDEENYELCAINKRYYIARNKLDELIELYNVGRSYLIDAVNEDSWYYRIGISDEISILWHRHTSFLVSALLLNHCMDYFLQILWAFIDSNQYIEKINLQQYKKHLKECDYKKVKKAVLLLPKNKKDALLNSQLWKDTFFQYDSCQEMRQTIVNVLKHQGYVHCQDLEKNDAIQVIWKIKSEEIQVNVEEFENKISLRDEKEIILKAFQGMRPLIEEYMGFLNPVNFFEVTKDGAIMIERMKQFPKWEM